jgi:hypothetical protein
MLAASTMRPAFAIKSTPIAAARDQLTERAAQLMQLKRR